MRLGVFGGSFDPLHVGHLIVADDVASALDLDRVLFVPTGEHPLKRSSIEAPATIRLRMVDSALAGSARFVVDDREVRRAGPSYTVDTLAELASENPGSELFLMVGADILQEIHKWHRVEELARTAQLVVMTRADADTVHRSEVEVDHLRVEVTHIAVFSSDVRRRIKGGRAFRYLVPDPVYRIIVENGLYRDNE